MPYNLRLLHIGDHKPVPVPVSADRIKLVLPGIERHADTATAAGDIYFINTKGMRCAGFNVFVFIIH